MLCEKPLSRRAGRCEAAFDVAEREGRLLMEAFMYRHNPQTQPAASSWSAAGAIGRLRIVRAAFSFAIADDANVRLAADLDGGALMDVGCYCVSAARLLAGEPERVSGRAGDSAATASTSRSPATMRFADEVLAHFDAGLALADRDELEVVGDEGTLFLDDPGTAASPVIELRRRRHRRADRARARSTPTGWRPRTSRRRSAARPSRCSDAPTRSARRGRSRPCTRPRAASGWRSTVLSEETVGAWPPTRTCSARSTRESCAASGPATEAPDRLSL